MSEPGEGRGLARWTVSFGAVIAAHAVLAWSVMHLQPQEGMPIGEPVMLELEPAAPPQQEQAENPPGPEETKTAEIEREVKEEPPPEPEKEPEPVPEPEQTAELPPEPEQVPEQVPEEEVAQVEPEPVPIPPAPPQVTPEVAVPLPEPKPEKPVEKKVEKKKVVNKKPRPRRERDENLSPSAQPRESAQASARSGHASNNAALATWRAMLSAHLQRHKQSISAGQSGRASLTFTVNRSGRVLSSSVGSSGVPAIDQAVRDLLRRAQPLPSAPAGVSVERQAFTVPFSFQR